MGGALGVGLSLPIGTPITARRLFMLAAWMGGFAGAANATEMTPAQRSFFETKIRPVLVKQCYECHSVNAKKLGGKLLLDAPSEMIAGGESGPPLIPGNPDDSLIIQALRYQDLEMPPKQRLPESVVNDFVTWVKLGAPDPRVESSVPARKLDDSKSDLWSLRPIRNPTPPAVQDKSWARDPVDQFVLAKLEAQKRLPTKDADARVIVRRLYFDLIGLPPTLREVEDFVSGRVTLSQIVDRLLDSPQYGERWGRHWLDVARYGESNGNDGLSRNASFPHAWRYRDYVIAAFNSDTPYDQFITEQIAGDLLPAATAEQRDRQLIATGFLAIGAKPAKAMNDNFEMDVVADQIGVIGSGIMGLSVGCARCHDHKTDPVPTRDYYALAGIFRSTETLWGAAGLQSLTAPQTALHELATAPKASAKPEVEAVIAANKPRKPASKPSFKYSPDAALAMGVREAKAVVDCKLNIDGDSKKLGPAIPRGFLSVFKSADIKPDAKQSGRLQLAQWIADPQHPLTARVMVNRVWLNLFGEGLVRTPDDFGAFGSPPSHPELLDYLATRFVQDGWSVKRLIRSLVLSRVYQLSSSVEEWARKDDPENLMLSHHNRRRLDAEALRDTMLVASGSLDRQPEQGSLIQGRDVLINELPPLHQPSRHRSVYLLMLRNSMPPELTPFNLPDALKVTGQRDSAVLATQSLYLLNNPFLVEQAQNFAARLQAQGDSADAVSMVRLAYELAFSRLPTDAEVRHALDFIRETASMLSSADSQAGQGVESTWAAFCQALLASNELRYID